jgi:hypothetical protein
MVMRSTTYTRNSTAERKRPEVNLTKLRSAISNGRTLFHDIDHRSAWMRRLRDLIADAVSDLGGAANISSAEMILIRRAAMLTLQTEMMEAHWAENEGEASSKSLETYQRTTNTLRRTLEALGLRRRARDVTPDLATYIASKREYEEVEA